MLSSDPLAICEEKTLQQLKLKGREREKRMEEINQHEAPSDLRQHSIPGNKLQSRHTHKIPANSQHIFKSISCHPPLISFYFFLPKCLSINYRYCCCHSSPISISIYSHSLSRFMLLQYKKLLLISNGVSIKRGARSQQGK